MTRTTVVSLVGIGLAAVLLISCIGPGLAVRAGLINEMLIILPPQARYQLYIRIGADALPWNRQNGQQAAINAWVHDREREDWHLVSLVRIPLGGELLDDTRNQYRWPSTQGP